MTRVLLAVTFAAVVPGGALRAADGPDYGRDVRLFLARYCLECHSADAAKGEFVLETREGLLKGGKRGPAVRPGKPDESNLVLMAEGKARPPMPPKKARQPSAAEVAVLRAWVAAGAKETTVAPAVRLPELKPRAAVTAPVTALAYRPDGKLLAAGRQHEVVLIDTPSNDVIGTLPPLSATVTALTFSPNSRLLAVAHGDAGTAGRIVLFAVGAGPAQTTRLRELAGHTDSLLDITFSPDSKLLATTGYDRLIKLWDVATGKEVRTLKDHSDAVYGLAFRPDGKLLASAAADRAVKVWDVATGTRLYSLGDATDWLYAVAWSPDSRHLAAGGVDKSIRVWEATPQGGRLVQSVFAHAGPVLRLRYAVDGKTLYSAGEDRTVKAWETAALTERKVYDIQPDQVLTFALSADQKRLALGRYDGVALVLDAASGKTLAQVLPPRPKPPQITSVTPTAVERGRNARVTFRGKHLDAGDQVVLSLKGASGRVVRVAGDTLEAGVAVAVDAAAGLYKIALKGVGGEGPGLPFAVDRFPAVAEQEPNDSPSTGQTIALPTAIAGSIERAGDVDFYRFAVKEGQEVGVQAVHSGSKFEPYLELLSPRGALVAQSVNGSLGYCCPEAGTYVLSVRDREYRGGKDMQYRLQVGDVPVVAGVYPLGVRRGTEARVWVTGANLGKEHVVTVKVPADTAPGSRVPVPIAPSGGPPLGDATVVVGEFPELVEPRAQDVLHAYPKDGGPHVNLVPEGMTECKVLPVPGTANGVLERPDAADVWQFQARKGQRLVVETNASRLGSPLDSVIELLDAHDRPVPRAVLRATARSYVTFRDHDSSLPGIRMETWGEFATDDFVWAGNELLRIRALPKNPDDDCQYYSVHNQRVGFLDTTPAHLPLGSPLYKVQIHRPGTTFPTNGMPLIHLDYRNDDGGPGYGKDSRLFFDPPADGVYRARVRDARGHGGPAYAYRLTVRPPRPDFTASFNPTAPTVWKGGAVPLTVTVERKDGYDGPIDLRLENLPSGFSAPPTRISANDQSTDLALWADATAPDPQSAPPLKLQAWAQVGNQRIMHDVTGGKPRLADPGDLVTTTEQPEVTLKPGGQVTLTARIERRNGFAGRVPLDVRGLPHGVRVLDIGLNGILITEKETTRTFVLYAEPWVEPTTQPFVVSARSERKGTDHAAKAVVLKVMK